MGHDAHTAPIRTGTVTGGTGRPVLGLVPLLALGVLTCGGPAGQEAGEEAPAPAVRDAQPPGEGPGYGVRLSVDRKVYGPGDTIRMRLTLFNRNDEPLVLNFPTAQRYDFLIRRSGDGTERRVLWRWSEGRFFTQQLGREVLGPDRPALEMSVAQPAPSAPGVYLVEATVPAEEWPVRAIVPVTVAP